MAISAVVDSHRASPLYVEPEAAVHVPSPCLRTGGGDIGPQSAYNHASLRYRRMNTVAPVSHLNHLVLGPSVHIHTPSCLQPIITSLCYIPCAKRHTLSVNERQFSSLVCKMARNIWSLSPFNSHTVRTFLDAPAICLPSFHSPCKIEKGRNSERGMSRFAVCLRFDVLFGTNDGGDGCTMRKNATLRTLTGTVFGSSFPLR